jgi:hypothetical protein
VWKGGKTTHRVLKRLVAEAFVPNPNGYKYVRVKDGNTENCDADNLEWVEKREYWKIRKKIPQKQKAYAFTPAKCRPGCIHQEIWHGNVMCCCYIFNEGHRRPCPPGPKCTEYKPKKANNGRAASLPEL